MSWLCVPGHDVDFGSAFEVAGDVEMSYRNFGCRVVDALYAVANDGVTALVD